MRNEHTPRVIMQATYKAEARTKQIPFDTTARSKQHVREVQNNELLHKQDNYFIITVYVQQ